MSNAKHSLPEVRNAEPSDAPRVHALLTQAFAHNVLPFTIYRVPQSVSRLAELTCAGGVRIVGDVEGVAIATDSHLSYLAVAEKARGKGLGRFLMEDFHANAGETTLDVLADNPALQWYEAQGYNREGEALWVHLAPKNTGEPPEHWDVALMEEKIKGFSAVGHAGMRIGLLGGSALRLLNDGGRSVRECLEILATFGFAGRREILLTCLKEPPEGYEAVQVLTSIRMRRMG